MMKKPYRRWKRRMKEPLTEELLDALLSGPSVESYLDSTPLPRCELSYYLQDLLAEKNLEQAAVVREAGLNATYGYEIFTGAKKRPSRDKILQLAFAMKLDLRETNRLLKTGQVSELYCKVRRDAIILYCIDNGYSLQAADEELYRMGEKTICQPR